jgi:hypothetical protein
MNAYLINTHTSEPIRYIPRMIPMLTYAEYVIAIASVTGTPSSSRATIGFNNAFVLKLSICLFMARIVTQLVKNVKLDIG